LLLTIDTVQPVCRAVVIRSAAPAADAVDDVLGGQS